MEDVKNKPKVHLEMLSVEDTVMSPETKKELFSALFKAQKSLQSLKKGSKNDFAGFTYAGVEDVVKECRAALHDHGLLFFPVKQSRKEDYVEQVYSLVHVISGESMFIVRTIVAAALPKMSPHQSQGAAESYMLKYMLRELLLLPRFDKNEDLDSLDNSGGAAHRVYKKIR